MSHKDNFDVVKELLKNNYTSFEGYSIPKKGDLTFDNRYKKVKNAVCVYLDMRHSRKIMFEQNAYKSLKTHRAFLHAFISCMDFDNGKFRSFNGDGALVFFTGEDSSAKAVRACMNFNKYMAEMNLILQEKGYMDVDYGIGISRGDIYVAKTGKKGDDATRQDLIWVGFPTYLAVELSDLGSGSYHLWISKAVYNQIQEEAANDKYNVLVNTEGDSIWHQENVLLNNGEEKSAYKTSYRFALDLN